MCRSVASQWQSTRSTCFARHLAEFFGRQFAADDALAKRRVSLVFQVDELFSLQLAFGLPNCAWTACSIAFARLTIKSIAEDMTSRIIEMGEVIGILTGTRIAYETVVDKVGALFSRNVTEKS